jgi:hypothetical protein
MTNSAISGFCDVNAEVQSADAGAKTDSAKIVM